MLGWLYQGRDFGDRSDLTELQGRPQSTEEKHEDDDVLLKSTFWQGFVEVKLGTCHEG